MSVNAVRPAKVWMWDGTLRDADGSWQPKSLKGSMKTATAIGACDAVIVAGGELPRQLWGGMDVIGNEGANSAMDPVGCSGTVVARSSANAASSAGFWTLLAPGASIALRDMDDIYRRWKRAGLLLNNDSGAWNRTLREKIDETIQEGWRVYAVSIFHLDPVAVRRLNRSSAAAFHGKGSRLESLTAMQQYPLPKDDDRYSYVSGPQLTLLLASDSYLRRVVRMAVRAVYSLGLDVGEAIIALHGSGRTAALSVVQPVDWESGEPSVAWKAAFSMFHTWYKAERNINERELRNTSILIGADPEFVLLRDDGRIVPANRYFDLGGGTGADALVVGRRIEYPIGEVRPDPASSPEGLAANVRRQLIRATSRVSDHSLRWAAGAMPVAGVALGGHIHVSGAALTSRLLRQLDRYVAMPVAMVESDNGRGRRPRYGALGDYRQQPHGGFEYRTLPSWLASPLTAKAAFALTLLCAKDTWALPVRPLMPEREEAAFYEGDRTELRGSLDAIAGELAGLPSYGEYARWIEPLFEAAHRGAVWDESADIRRKWRVGSFSRA